MGSGCSNLCCTFEESPPSSPVPFDRLHGTDTPTDRPSPAQRWKHAAADVAAGQAESAAGRPRFRPRSRSRSRSRSPARRGVKQDFQVPLSFEEWERHAESRLEAVAAAAAAAATAAALAKSLEQPRQQQPQQQQPQQLQGSSAEPDTPTNRSGALRRGCVSVILSACASVFVSGPRK